MNLHRPYIVSWNLTNRCNLACEHCYLDAGGIKDQVLRDKDPAFSDRSELNTEQCFRVMDQLKDFAPESITILTGGEPLLRRDILDIVKYGHSKDLWMVMGTNGVFLTENVALKLKDAGIRGFALSLDAIIPEVHDLFRRVQGAWANTVQGAKVLHEVDLSFIVQTTVGKHNVNDVEAICDFAHDEMGAKVFNLYFLVQTGRGQFVSDISPAEYNKVLDLLYKLQKKYDGRMIVNAKCAPHYTRHLFEKDKNSKFLKTFTGGAGGCPAGTQYMGIRPNGDVTPCPYLPQFGGNLKTDSLAKIWNESEIFTQIRNRDDLGGRCKSCEFNGHCGGCRARAYGVLDDYMAEDPLCDYEPGKYTKESVKAIRPIEYGLAYSQANELPNQQPGQQSEVLDWEPAAEERMKAVPAFVRGMVKKSVESYCLKNKIKRVTVEELSKIRSKMATSKIFGKPKNL